ncbi:MAG: ribbon-helix-helix domain-containing protein [bacterium]|nr:ribbon-helix-helix domain-containing protein [bacterium]
MPTLTIRLEKSLIERMDRSIKLHHYSTRSEYIREAIREKIIRLNELKDSE